MLAIAGVVVLAGILAIARFKLDAGAVDASDSASTPLADLATGPGTPRPATSTQATLANYPPPDFKTRLVDPLPEETGTWSEIYAALAPAAKAGDAEANFRLYRVGLECHEGPRTAPDLADAKYRANAAFFDPSTGAERRKPQADAVISRLESTYARCKDASTDEVAQYPSWLTAAAEAGYLRALLAYGSATFPGDEAVDVTTREGAAVAAERGATSLRYLEEAARRGSIDAVAELAFRYGEPHGPDRTRNLVASFAHWYAYAWYESRYENDGGRRLNTIDERGKSLNPYDFQTAVEKGREILRAPQCCIKVPETRENSNEGA
jgi:hypothetical protein